MKRLQLRRVSAGHYETPDGEYYVWQSRQLGLERGWYVNSLTCDREGGETLVLGGFPTKRAAVAWLRGELAIC